MSRLTLSQGHLFGALYEAILFGINFILFLFLVYLFMQEKKTTRSQRVSGSHLCPVFFLRRTFVMRALYVAFFVSDVSPDIYYLDHTQTLDLVEKAFYAAATVVSDGLLILRAYVIFEGKWPAVIFPSLSLAVTFGTWIALIFAYSQQTPGTILFPHNVAVLAVLSFVMSFVTNVVITVMICVRIWIVMRRFRDTGISTSFYKQFITFTVESGLIYPVVLVVTGVFFLTNNNALEILSGSNTQVLGIVPILLTLQLRFNLSVYENNTIPNTQNSNISTLPAFNSGGYRSHNDGTELAGMPHTPRTVVKLTRSTNYSSESGGDSFGSQTKKAEDEV
ncbi:hypothetical protein MSAN_02113400 [Mycena sanguinolenta]|uniref:Uncharacterized protein n=1 Tax=Mycena sanguinolenta TaxID=230812 RepID=A0A8H7CKF3_9AGAR|nr:hypothetical protein MSAN_02113400 [Mycena sanguinolenta]